MPFASLVTLVPACHAAMFSSSLFSVSYYRTCNFCSMAWKEERYLLFILFITCSQFTTTPEWVLTQSYILSWLTSPAMFISSIYAAPFKEFSGSTHIFSAHTLPGRIFTHNAPQLDNTRWLKHGITPRWIHLANCWPQLPAPASQGGGKLQPWWMNLSCDLASTIWCTSVYEVCLSDTALDAGIAETK